MLTRKHFQAIADCVSETLATHPDSDVETLHNVATELARMCKASNPRFNRERFLDACNLPPHVDA